PGEQRAVHHGALHARQSDAQLFHLEEVLIALTADPTITTATAPITLCHRNAMSRVQGENATVSTTAMPAMRPQNAPAPVVSLTISVARWRIASTRVSVLRNASRSARSAA